MHEQEAHRPQGQSKGWLISVIDLIAFGKEVSRLARAFKTEEAQQAYLQEREVAYLRIVEACKLAGCNIPKRQILSGE